jgi:CzcA family heavy metal efflux pump
MMRWIVESSLKYRLVVIAVAVAVMAAGARQLSEMPVDVLPEFTPTMVEIQTEALGLSAPEVEQLITVPMEQDLLNGVAWLQDIRSESVPGLSRIQLIFEPGTDLMRARQVVQERLTEAHALPQVSRPPQMIQPLSSLSRIMMARLSSDEVSPIDMSVIAHWTIKPRLLGVPGVANVAIWGERDRQLQVQVDPQRLQDQGVSLLDVIETAGNALWVSPLTFLEASTPGTGGFIDTPNQRLGIQHLLPIKTADDLAQVPLTTFDDGQELRLSDVATVVEDHQPLIGDNISGDGDGDLLLVIEKFPDANTLEVTQGVEAALAALAPGLAGIEVDTSIYQPASSIETAIGNLGAALLVGAFLLVLVVAAFSYDWRSTVISAVVIPLSLVAAGLVLYLRGVGFNAVILTGFVVALAALVGDAVTPVDAIRRRLTQQRQEMTATSTADVIRGAVLETRGPLVYATLIGLLALLPVFFVGFTWGLPSAFFGPLALSYAVALLASMVVALTVTPALALLLLRNAPLDRHASPLVDHLQHRYDQGLARIVRRPRWALGIWAGLLALGLAVLPLAGHAMIPSLQDQDMLIHWEGAPGTSLPEMNRVTGLVVQELQAIPGVRNVGAHVGRAISSDQSTDVNGGEIWVSLDPSASHQTTVAAIQEVVNGYPGLDREVLTYSDERLREILSGSPDAVVVRLYGQDLDILRAKAEEIRGLVGGIEGVTDPHLSTLIEEPNVEIEVDLARAQEFGVKPGDVRRAAATLLSGMEVGNLFEDQKVFSVVVWGAPETRHSVTSVQELLIDTPSGEQVRLGDVADVRVAPSVNTITHDGVFRYIDVGAGVVGRDANAVSGDIARALEGVEFPLEYHAEVLGHYAAQQADQQKLLGFSIAALVGIFLLLQAAFGSWGLAGVVFLALPAALAGGLVAALAVDRAISLGALAGLLGVFLLTARNALVLVTRYQQRERDEGEAFRRDLVVSGARERVAPVVTTALATGLALLPLVGPAPVLGNEIVRSAVVVILGGLVTATLVSLFVLPPLYLSFAPSPQTETDEMPWSTQPAMGSAD